MSDFPGVEIGSEYANIIDEVKQRLIIVERALSRPHEDSLDWLAVSDLCSVQFRKVFEGIALGCLLVHGDEPSAKRLKDDKYRADELLKAVEKIHSAFYPVPSKVVLEPGTDHLRVMTYESGEFLSKTRLKKLYHTFDQELHVGTLSRRVKVAEPISKESLTTILLWTRALLFDHTINLRNRTHRFVVQMNAPGTVPKVTCQRKAGDKRA